MQAIGFLGFAFYPDIAPHLWSILCGAGLGGAFSLTIVTALEHLPAVKSAGALTALMQGGGFLIAAEFHLCLPCYCSGAVIFAMAG